MPLRVIVIVEGHGEDSSIRTLLERIWYEYLGGDFIEVIPWRAKQGQLLSPEGLVPILEAAAIKLHATSNTDFRRLLLIMIDTEGHSANCPKNKAPELVNRARQIRSDALTEIACVLPNVMFETWFVAAAESLRNNNNMPADLPKPTDPEADGLGKSWIRKHLPRKYKETVDQARFVACMSLTECMNCSRSFRKLVKELQLRLPPITEEDLPTTKPETEL